MDETRIPTNKFYGFVSRWEFIIARCKNRKVLHLGCIGITEGSMDEKIKAMKEEKVLHAVIRRTASHLTGIDYDFKTVNALRKLGYSEILYGDVTRLNEVELNGPFDVVVCGDLIEHLSNPGTMLDGLKPLVSYDSEIIITTPNSFGLLPFLRYISGRYKEGNDHVLSFQIYTLENLLKRHGYVITEIWSCYNRPPRNFFEKMKYSIGIAFFKIFPKLGGTLCVVAKFRP